MGVSRRRVIAASPVRALTQNTQASEQVLDLKNLSENGRESPFGRHKFVLSCQERQILPLSVLTPADEHSYESKICEERSWAGYNLGREVCKILQLMMLSTAVDRQLSR